MKTFTVVGFDNHRMEPFVRTIKAEDSYEAAAKAAKIEIEERELHDEDLGVVTVFEGTPKRAVFDTSIAWGTTLLGMLEPDPNRN